MQQRVSLVTLAVADLDATRRFYLDGLAWQPEIDVAGDVLMLRAGGYTGYFADPDGYRWEIAWNPGQIADIVLP